MKKPLLVLLLITFLGGLVRFFWLDRFPVAPNWDEISHGYNAYSILMTGKDEWGNRLPLIFRAFGDYKLPVYIYLTTIPVWLFGLSVFSIRFISALAGTLAIPGIYLLTNSLFPKYTMSNVKSKINIGLLSAFFLALLPWHFFISRPALEANLALTLIIFGFYFLIRFINTSSFVIPGSTRNPSGISLLVSSVLLGLSLHTYNTARVFVPTLLLAFLVIYWKQIKLIVSSVIPAKAGIHSSNTEFGTNLYRFPIRSGMTSIRLALLIFAFFATIVAFQIFTGVGTARYSKLNIITESTAYTLGQKRIESGLPPIVAKFVFNRPVYFVQTFINNYFEYFTPSFFNQSRGAQSQFAIPGANLLGFPVMVLFLIGLFYLLKNPGEKSHLFLLAWLLLSPIASALTVDPPQALRPNPMIPAIVIIASLGLLFVLIHFSSSVKRFATVTVILLIALNFGIYLNNYLTLYPKVYSESWMYGYREVFEYLNTQKNFNKIFISKRYGEPHIFYAFFNKLDPKKLQPGGDNVRFEKSGWFWTDKIGEVYFINDWQVPATKLSTLPLESGGEVSTTKSLLVASPDNLPAGANVLKTINFLDGSTAFKIIELP